MQFLLMCCFEEPRWSALAESDRTRVMQQYDNWVQEQAASGRYVTGGKLDESRAATTVRERGGKPMIVDGPFSEAKEQIGGYHVIACRDRDEAIAIAQKVPTLRVGGTVEVRPLLRQLGDANSLPEDTIVGTA